MPAGTARIETNVIKGKNELKEIEFSKDKLEKPCKEWLKAEGKTILVEKINRTGHYELKKVARFFFKTDKQRMSQRMCLSELTFGTIKRAMGSTHFLLRGLEKVEGEFALFCLGYNLERAKNILGFNKIMELMAGV